MLDRWFSRGARFAPVLLRGIVGIVAVLHGWPKMKDLGAFIERIGRMGVPIPSVFGTDLIFPEIPWNCQALTIIVKNDK